MPPAPARDSAAALRRRALAARLSLSGMAWAVPGGLAALVTGYLAWGAWVSAHDPSWFTRSIWWRAWLRPGDGGLLLVFTALWLAAALAYWWPRRRRLSDVGLVVVAAMVVIGAVLGTASFAPCHGRQSGVAVAAWVLELFVGSLEPQYGQGAPCPGPLPLALQIGRTVALGATFVGAIAATAVLWRQPVARLRARLVKDASILTGLDAMTLPLLRRLTTTGRPSGVVVIEPDANHPLLEEARATGAQIVIADPASPHVLLPLLRGLRGPQLRFLFALWPQAAQNDAILRAAGQVLGNGQADPERPPHLIARLDDPRHADVWRGRHVAASPLWFEDALSPQESTARSLVDQLAVVGASQVLLCGDNTLALAVLLELARRAWEEQGLAAAAVAGGRPAGTAPAGRVIVMDRRAADLRREFLATSPPSLAAALPAVDACDRDWHEHLLPALDALPPDQAAATAVLITDPPSGASLHEAGRAARLHPATPVFVLISDGAGVAGAAFDRLRPFQRTLLVGNKVPEDSWTRLARYWHEAYRLSRPAGADDSRRLTRRPWDELDDFIRQDNILQLRSVMRAVTGFERQWVPVRAVPPGSLVELTDGEVRHVACQEHARWYTRRRQAGWRPAAAGEPDDDTGRVNSNVRPWEELPAGVREQAERQVRDQLGQLEAVGYLPSLPAVGPAVAATFQRVGEVRAVQLTGGRTWRTSTGDELHAGPGDWLVTDDSGNERTVRDGEFLASHAALGGDRWRRTGTSRAWQVGEATRLRTMEGPALAQPGDWIVQGPGGERWPVTAPQFARGYAFAAADRTCAG